MHHTLVFDFQCGVAHWKIKEKNIRVYTVLYLIYYDMFIQQFSLNSKNKFHGHFTILVIYSLFCLHPYNFNSLLLIIIRIILHGVKFKRKKKSTKDYHLKVMKACKKHK